MALVQFGSRSFDADLVAFDKDGTLIDLDLWGPVAEAWVENLAPDPSAGELRQELYRAIGYDPQRHYIDPQGPLAMASSSQLQTITAAVLFRFGLPWAEAEERTRLGMQAGANLHLPSLIRPAADVAGILGQLKSQGIRVAVVTSDDRGTSEETLELLGVAHLVDHLVCGNDGILPKPAPDMLLATLQTLGIEARRAAVVGDTVADLVMAQRAGAGLRVAVLTGAGGQELLGAYADVVLGSIDEISAVGQPAGDSDSVHSNSQTPA